MFFPPRFNVPVIPRELVSRSSAKLIVPEIVTEAKLCPPLVRPPIPAALTIMEEAVIVEEVKFRLLVELIVTVFVPASSVPVRTIFVPVTVTVAAEGVVTTALVPSLTVPVPARVPADTSIELAAVNVPAAIVAVPAAVNEATV
jgi:hypothetical protein